MEESISRTDAAGKKDLRTAGEGGNASPSLEECIRSSFALPEKDWEQYTPLTLAYLGDCVFDMVVRTVLVKRSQVRSGKIHQKASGIVRAVSQARIAEALKEDLTDEEAAVFRRGRNASPDHNAKNATRREYLEATGLEALIGYLYLKGENERLVELIHRGTVKAGCEL